MRRSQRQEEILDESRRIEGFLIHLAGKAGIFTEDLELNDDRFGLDIVKTINEESRIFADLKGTNTCYIDYKNGEEIKLQNPFYIFKEQQILEYENILKSGFSHINYWLFKLYDLNTCEHLNRVQNEWYQKFNSYDYNNLKEDICVIKEEISLYTVSVREIVDIYQNTDLWRKLKLPEAAKHHYVGENDSPHLIKISRDHLHGTLIDLRKEWSDVPPHIKKAILDWFRKGTC